MCSIVILRRPSDPWPVVIGANRDEMRQRPWTPPGRLWSDRPQITAGLDLLAGGTWMGANDDGVVAAILNRMNSLGPLAGARSRGELVLEALDHADAWSAASALGEIDVTAYRAFNMVVIDDRAGFWLRNLGAEEGARQVEIMPLPVGYSMITSHDRNDLASPRIAAFLPRFEAAEVPRPSAAAKGGDWHAWEELLAAGTPPGAAPGAAMTIDTDDGFGTVSSSLLALPARPTQAKPVWRFAAGRPDRVPFKRVAL
jgi:transport and Golgi organization protein 2